MLHRTNLSKNLNKAQKLWVEHGPRIAIKKIAHVASTKFSQPSGKRTLLKRADVFNTLDKKALLADIDQLLSFGLLRPIDDIKSDIRTIPDDVAHKIVAEADRLLRKKFTIYGTLKLNYNPKGFSWQLDPLTGFIWPPTLRASNVVSQKPAGTDIKTIWEIARFQFLCPLAYAYVLTSEKHYAHQAINMVNSSIDENPFLQGPHWTRAMEASIRLTNWCFYLPLMDISALDHLSFRSKLVNSFLEHLIYVRENLENAPPRANNHYLANLAALVLGGLVFPSMGWAVENARFGQKELAREIEVQFSESGINFEGSLPYHRLSSEICLIALALIKKSGSIVHPTINQRLRKAAGFTRYCTETSNQCPNIGDNDSGIFVKFFMGQEFNQYRYLGYLFDSILGDPHEPTSTEEFLCGIHFTDTHQPPDPKYRKLNKETDSQPQVKDFAGLIIARHRNEALFFNMLHSTEGHTHNDKLSVYPVIGGKLLFIDRGSFSYTGFLEKRHKDRMTASHNVPVLNGWEQNRLWISDPFYMSGDARCGNSVKRSRDVLSITGWHDGYRRYRRGLKICRTVIWDVRRRTILISDWANGKNSREEFQFTWYFLINPVWSCVIQDRQCIFASGTQEVRLEAVGGASIALGKGIYCPSYQVESPCPVLTASRKVPAGKKIEFVLRY